MGIVSKNVILCGYHWTGCKALKELVGQGCNVYVYTHENPPHVNSLEAYCKSKAIPYSLERIKKSNLPFKPDLICSIFYRYLIDGDVISAVNGKIFNLHPSLLPKYRGCSSLTWAMINGEKEAGYSYHYINEKYDEGKIILQQRLPIEGWDTQMTLYHRVMFEAMRDFIRVVTLVEGGSPGLEQSSLDSSYYKRGCPYDGVIDDNWPIEKIDRFIRALVYPPLPYAKYRGKEVRTLEEYLAIKTWP
jgi:methionyl-tRNA formyltransferase